MSKEIESPVGMTLWIVSMQFPGLVQHVPFFEKQAAQDYALVVRMGVTSEIREYKVTCV